MKEINDYLTQLDFSKIEIKLYLTLLKNGSMTVADLAKKAHINRTAAYGHIEALFSKGVLIQAKGKKNEIYATSPENLKYLVESKVMQVNSLQNQLPSIIQTLTTAFIPADMEDKSEIKHYQGKNAIKALYDDCLKSNEIHAYFDSEKLAEVLPENYKLFDDAIQNNPKLVVYEIAQDSSHARRQLTEKGERHYWKFLPNDIKLTSNDILIYDGKVAIVNLKNKEDIDGVILSNRDYYNNSKQLFELLWRFLPEPQIK